MYNCTRNEATGFAPYLLLFGHRPRLPIDVMFGVPSLTSYQDYAEDWRKRTREAYKVASRGSQKGKERGKALYDKKVHGAELLPGNRVLVRNFKEKGGPGKLRPFWEEQVHVVTSRKYQTVQYMKSNLRVVKEKREYCTKTCCYHYPSIYLSRRNTYLEGLKERISRTSSRRPRDTDRCPSRGGR